MQVGEVCREPGDYIEYRTAIEIDPDNTTFTITVNPLASNLSMAGWSPRTAIWDYSAPDNATLNDEPRGGLTSTWPLADLHAAEVAIGFSANGPPRECRFRDMIVETAAYSTIAP